MKKILVVVDMQNDFLTGTLANESAVAIIPNIKREIESGVYDHIIFTRDTHHEDYLNTQEGQRLPYIHCVEDTDGWKVSDELIESATGKSYSFLNKPTFGFNDWNWYMWDFLHINGDEVEFSFTGTCTDICVVSNALAIKSAFPPAPVKCITDCCAPLFGSSVKQEAAFEVMTSCQIDVIR